MQRSAFKTVHRALDSELGCEVAWNSVNLKDFSSEDLSFFSNSVKLNRQLFHKNIVSVITSWVSKCKSELVIITEIVTGGSLKAYLLRLPNPKFRLIRNWCRGILAGLAFLHSQSPPVVHCDLSTLSVFLMCSDGTVKLSEFYLNKLFAGQSPLLATPEYLAPEVFEGLASPKSDIYSFGMTLLEMCTQVRPFSECLNSAQVLVRVKNNLFPESLQMIQDDEIRGLIELCISHQDIRPTAVELLNHEVLKLEDSTRNNLPVTLHPKHTESPVRKRHVKTLSLILRDSKNCAKSVSFEFNPESDTPEKVAIEMIESFNLDKAAVIKVAKEIEKKLENVKSPRLGVQIFRDKRTDHEPHTAGLVMKKIPLLNSYKSVDDTDTSELRIKEMLAVIYGNDVYRCKSIRSYIEMFQVQEGLQPDGKISEKLYKLMTHRIRKEN
jgi:WNK lysine deficient protein kinase